MKAYTSTATFSLTEEGILEIVLLDNDLKIDLVEAQAHIVAAEKTAGPIDLKKILVLIDARLSKHELTSEAKDFIAKSMGKKAEAIVVKELHQRIIATFYLKLSNSVYNHPVKVFTNRDEAVKWLLTFK